MALIAGIVLAMIAGVAAVAFRARWITQIEPSVQIRYLTSRMLLVAGFVMLIVAVFD